MATPAMQAVNTPRKKMTKQLTGKRDDTPLHSAARAGKLAVLKDIILGTDETELHELLAKQNQDGETPLYIAAEYGYVDVVREMIQYYDLVDAGIKARNGFDALHIAAKQGDLGNVVSYLYLIIFCLLDFKREFQSPLLCCRCTKDSYGGSS